MKKMILLAVLVWVCAPLGFAVAQSSGSAQSVEARLERLEALLGNEQRNESMAEPWSNRIQLSGVVEVEAGYAEVDFADPLLDDERVNDVDLATVELSVDANVADHVVGHVMFKYEADDVFVDEGIIIVSGGEAGPVYLTAGRQYVPIGYYDSLFVTDPNTLVLGETNDGSVVAGIKLGDEMLDISVGAFNGTVDEAGHDDVIEDYVGAVSVSPLDLITFGASYTSNLASSRSLSQCVVVPTLKDKVGGWSAFATLELLERFTIIGEYLGATKAFAAGELYDPADTEKRKPAAWNVEVGVGLVDKLEVAVRYGGSDDGGADFLPEKQHGLVVNWSPFGNANLALEYLHNEFDGDQQAVDTYVAQLAVEF